MQSLDLSLKNFLDEKASHYNSLDFIKDDPILIPHSYNKIQDIEISGFLAAILAWGKRSVIIKKCKELLNMMDNAPHDFILNHQTDDLKRFLEFKHRTFNATDALYVISFLHHHYQKHNTLEDAFVAGMSSNDNSVEKSLTGFNKLFFSLEDAPRRTQKHIATPERKSACKRLNMFLRWMVRQDNVGVDFGIWQRIKPHQLVCPCDVHVIRVAKKLKLLQRKNTDWQAALELTNNLKQFCPEDPVRYDFALFGIGIVEKF